MAKLCTTSRVRKSKTEADTLAQRESQHSSGVDVQEADTGPTLHSTHSAYIQQELTHSRKRSQR